MPHTRSGGMLGGRQKPEGAAGSSLQPRFSHSIGMRLSA